MNALLTATLSTLALLSLLLLWLAMDRTLTRRRLALRLVELELVEAPPAPARASGRSVGLDLLRQLGAALASYWPRAQLILWRRALVRAGLLERLGVEEFLALRILAAVAGVLIGAATATLLGPYGVILSLSGGLLGYFAPSLVVEYVARQRRAAIERLLPVTIDMLAVSLTAGLSFDSAVLFVCERVDNELTRELRHYLSDMHLGAHRRDALTAIAERTQSPAVNQFVRAVVQADQMGSGMARTLSSQARALREVRRLRAQERAGQATIKLMVPLVLFMMPALFILILGPAVLQALRMFQGR